MASPPVWKSTSVSAARASILQRACGRRRVDDVRHGDETASPRHRRRRVDGVEDAWEIPLASRPSTFMLDEAAAMKNADLPDFLRYSRWFNVSLSERYDVKEDGGERVVAARAGGRAGDQRPFACAPRRSRSAGHEQARQ